jgi:CheY-like chemotaxis protein
MPSKVKTAVRRVLVVDDELDTAETLSFLLRDAGHQVEFAINGYAAIELAHRLRPDIIFLDLGLPDIDGFQLARDLRRVPGLEGARIVAVTGRGREAEERALEAGCDECLRKPVAPALIERAIDSLAG